MPGSETSLAVVDLLDGLGHGRLRLGMVDHLRVQLAEQRRRFLARRCRPFHRQVAQRQAREDQHEAEQGGELIEVVGRRPQRPVKHRARLRPRTSLPTPASKLLHRIGFAMAAAGNRTCVKPRPLCAKGNPQHFFQSDWCCSATYESR